MNQNDRPKRSARRIALFVWSFAIAPAVILVLLSSIYMSVLGITCCSASDIYALLTRFGTALIALLAAITWPIVALIGFWLLTSNRASRALASLAQRFKSVKVLGSEVVFSAEGARELSADVQDTFASYRNAASAEIARLARTYRVKELLNAVFSGDSSDQRVNDCAKRTKFRCTIHIEDLLFERTLFQLVDYFPKGSGAGRSFSVRYGIIGLTWRLGRHHGGSKVPKTDEELIENWGMTRDEAQVSSRQSSSYLCVLMRHSKSGLPIGLIFMDSQDETAFGSSPDEHEELASRIVNEAIRVQLVKAVEEVVETVQKFGARIPIHG